VIFENHSCVQMSIPKTGTYSMYAMINELPLGDRIEDVIRSDANAGRLDDSSFLGSGAMGSAFRVTDAGPSLFKYDFHTHGHFTYTQWLKYLEAIPYRSSFSKYQDFMTFSFVRNPYDRMVSIWRAHYDAHERNLPDPVRFREFCIRYIAPYAGTESGFCFTNGLMYRFLTQTEFLVDDINNRQICLGTAAKIENAGRIYDKLRDLNPSLPKFSQICQWTVEGFVASEWLFTFREFCVRHLPPGANDDLLRSKRSKLCFTNGLLYRFLTQTGFLVDDAGQIGVDFVGRIENLKDDYEKLRDLNPSLPNFNEGYHLNKSEREHRLTLDYQHYYYDKDIKEMIYDIFEEDFINFGYEK